MDHCNVGNPSAQSFTTYRTRTKKCDRGTEEVYEKDYVFSVYSADGGADDKSTSADDFGKTVRFCVLK